MQAHTITSCYRLILLIAIMIVAVGCSSYPGIRPFKTDGCSMCPDGSWGHCCEAHDIPYWKGGTAGERWDADVAMFKCVREETNWLWASVMFVGVRIGGFPYWPFPWRWGFGWDYAKGYGKLTPEEEAMVNEELPAALKAISRPE